MKGWELRDCNLAWILRGVFAIIEMASLLHRTGGFGIVNFEMFLRWTVYLEDIPCYATECRSKLMQSFSIELSLKLPEAFKGNNTADHIILFDKNPDMSTKIPILHLSGEAFCKKKERNDSFISLNFHMQRSCFDISTHLLTTRCQIWCTIELHRDPISKVLLEW